jgi:superoxide dismutase, Fe-Mn family
MIEGIKRRFFMAITFPSLPFSPIDVSDWISSETLDYHHGKHHRSYVEQVNQLIRGTSYEDASLEEIVLQSEGELFNNAAQSWNHSFYWLGLGGRSSGKRLEDYADLTRALKESFGTVETFREKFTEASLGLLGSGWIWLVENHHREKLEILQTCNAGNPMKDGLRPLLVCDVWEHAYYIDFRNSRANYVSGFLKSINWGFVAQNLSPRRDLSLPKSLRASFAEESRRWLRPVLTLY